MRRPLRYALAATISTLACSARDQPAGKAAIYEMPAQEARDPGGTAPTDETSAADTPAVTAPVTDEQRQGSASASDQLSLNGPTFSNVVPSGGRVRTTLGVMTDVETAGAIQHVFQSPDEPFQARIYLRYHVVDHAGNLIIFNIDYLNETQPFAMAGRGFLTTGLINDQASENYATGGTVTVSSEAEGKMRLSFQGIEMSHRNDDGTVIPAPPLGDGIVTGDVERVCIVDTATGDRVDSTWSNPFCAAYAK